VYLAYSNVDNEISSGFAATPIADSQDLEAGASVDFPLGRWTVSGQYRFIDADSDISSSVSNIVDISARVRLLSSTSLQIGIHDAQVDIMDSPEDNNRRGYTVALNSRLPGGWQLNYSGRYSEDDGGSLIRKEVRHSLRLNWAFRLVRFSFSASDSTVNQGQNEQNYTTVDVRLMRYFR
jgi:hypothetical protein